MNLARPPPKVEAATATAADNLNEASAEAAVPSGKPIVQKPTAVGPAVTMDDPRKFAPKEAVNPDNTTAKKKLLSVQHLRGSTGADFESVAAVLHGAPKKMILKKILPFIFDERDFVAFSEVKRFVLVKGDCCFVYMDETDLAPLYAIPLEDIVALKEDPKRPDKYSVTISPTGNGNNIPKETMQTILFKYKSNGKQAHQFTFDAHNDKSIGKRFLDVVDNASKSKPKIDAVVSDSLVYAKQIAKEAAKAQPKN